MKEKILKYMNKFAGNNGLPLVHSFNDLNDEERDTYRKFEEVLRGRSITDSDYRSFLEKELEIAVTRLTDVDLKVEDAIYRKVEVRFIKKILNFLDMPAIEKVMLENQINI